MEKGGFAELTHGHDATGNLVNISVVLVALCNKSIAPWQDICDRVWGFKIVAKKLYTAFFQELPDGYRMVFNLNVIEGYTHKEIGEMLNISENTSKSQLSRARSVLQEKLKNKVKGD